MPIQAVYYRDAEGNEPVREFVRSLDVKRRVALRHQIDRVNLLTDEAPHLPFPVQLAGRR